MSFSHDPSLNEIGDKVEAGERLSFAEGVALFASNDLNALGKLADTARRRRHGRAQLTTPRTPVRRPKPPGARATPRL